MNTTSQLDLSPVAFDWKRWLALLGGLAIFLGFYFNPPCPTRLTPLV